MPHFKGYIHDVGGPTANFRHPSCKGQAEAGPVQGKEVPGPQAVPGHCRWTTGNISHMLRAVARPSRRKKGLYPLGHPVRLSDGRTRTRLFSGSWCSITSAASSRWRPSTVPPGCWTAWAKPHYRDHTAVPEAVLRDDQKIGKKQYLVPYLMSSHPGSTLRDAVELALLLKKEELHPEQVQDFYPTPGTISTCMFYTGLDPLPWKESMCRAPRQEKAMQRALIQYFLPKTNSWCWRRSSGRAARTSSAAGRTALSGGPRRRRPRGKRRMRSAGSIRPRTNRSTGGGSAGKGEPSWGKNAWDGNGMLRSCFFCW